MPAERSGFTEVLAGARDGAESAWRRLHLEFAPGLGGYLSACGIGDVEQEVGEVFVGAARSIRDFDGDIDDFEVLLFRIAVARVGEQSTPRAPARRRKRAEDDGPRPEFAVAAMQALDPAVRDTILLRRLGKLSVEQVARVLETTPDMVFAYEEQGVTGLKGSVF